uniref:Secreted protein n=1 Tax=Steinernema glaseri TaxID=37863 RepID=A0A1I7ZCW6_9BILA
MPSKVKDRKNILKNTVIALLSRNIAYIAGPAGITPKARGMTDCTTSVMVNMRCILFVFSQLWLKDVSRTQMTLRLKAAHEMMMNTNKRSTMPPRMYTCVYILTVNDASVCGTS